MVKTKEDELSGGEKKLILLVTVILLFVTIGVFISSYMGKEKEVVVVGVNKSTTTILRIPADSKYILESLPENFKLIGVMPRTVETSDKKDEISLLQAVYRRGTDEILFYEPLGNESFLFSKRALHVSNITQLNSTKFNELVYIVDSNGLMVTYFWVNNNTLLSISSGYHLENELNIVTKFLAGKFPPTERLP